MAIHKLTLPLPPVHRQEMRRRTAAAAAHQWPANPRHVQLLLLRPVLVEQLLPRLLVLLPVPLRAPVPGA